jgi:tetratricopeptide (TPR) repeat protein
LAELAEDTALPGIVRATALDLIGLANDVETAARLEPLLQDEDPLVRAAAIPIQRAADPQDKALRILNLLSDPVASVRITAAREMLDAKVAQLPERMDLALRSAMAEWQESLRVKFDFPEGQMVIGGTGLVLRNLPGALQAFREAALLDPQLVQAWRMIITLEVVDGNLPGAKKALKEALEHNPNSALLESISRQLR